MLLWFRSTIDVGSCIKLDVLRRFLTVKEMNKGKSSCVAAASAVVTEIEDDLKRLNLFPKQWYHIRQSVLNLYKGFQNARKSYKQNKVVQKQHVLKFYNSLFDKFPCTQKVQRAERNPKTNNYHEQEVEEEEDFTTSDDESTDPNFLIAEAKSQLSNFIFINPKVCRLLDSLGISSNSMARIFMELKELNKVKGCTSSSF